MLTILANSTSHFSLSSSECLANFDHFFSLLNYIKSSIETFIGVMDQVGEK